MITPSPTANAQDVAATHTPGPWPITETGDGKRFVIGEGLVGGPKGYEVAEVYSDDAPYEETIANARVIAAAPDLLDELREARTTLNIVRTQIMVEIAGGRERWEGVPDALQTRLNAIDAAIAKATAA